MKRAHCAGNLTQLVEPYRVASGKEFKLSKIDPADTGPVSDKQQAGKLLKESVQCLSDLQGKLYAQDHWSLLLIFQAMDAAGKDGTIKHVMSGINPQGCQVYSFKQPSAEEMDHDYMWRYMRCLPERGRIGIFNRSYYEEVLVVRVHPGLLTNQRLPAGLVGDSIWSDRLDDIKNIEHYLGRNGTVILKFFLHLSRKEQKKRFLQRLERPEKHWKFSASDLKEREFWDQYMTAYEQAIKATATKAAPWYVVPADNKWFTRMIVAGAIVDQLEKLELDYPSVSPAKQRELQEAREKLQFETNSSRRT